MIALLGAVLIAGATTVAFLVFEPALGPWFAFWPGLLVQRLLHQLGVSTTNRILLWATLTWWWCAVWLTLAIAPRAVAFFSRRDAGAR